MALSAQEKGDFAVGGIIGVQGGSVSTSISSSGTTSSTSAPSATKFTFNPTFSYFVINNLELSAGLDYDMNKTFSGEKDGKNYFDFTHIALFQLGAHYYVPLIKGVLFYTPGFNIGFGGGSYVENVGPNAKTTTKVPFALGCDLNFAKFELKITKNVGLSFNLLDLGISYTSIDTGNKNIKAATTDVSAGLNYGASIGARYYF